MSANSQQQQQQQQQLEYAIDVIARARSVTVLTGAGVSAESGVPTFRDAQEGHWAQFDPAQLATPEAFLRDPELVTRWYDHRRQELQQCKPNAAHVALADLEKTLNAINASFTLLTQNVDGLHFAAGSHNVHELHGSIHTWRCTKTGQCFSDLPVPLPNYPMKSDAGGFLRPNVVWFGEMLPQEALEAADRAINECDLFLSLGTSSVVYPAAGFAHVARSRGASVIEINPDETPISSEVDCSIREKAGVALAEIVPNACARMTSP